MRCIAKDSLFIRAMLEADINKIINNYQEQNWPKQRETIENYLARQIKNELFMFVAECRDNVAGYAVLYPDTDVGPFALEKIPTVRDLIVFEKYQRVGIGNRILDEVEKKASELSGKVQISVGLHSGYGSAQRLYIKRGYIPDGTGCWYNDSRPEQYADCKNDDNLVLYLSKQLH